MAIFVSLDGIVVEVLDVFSSFNGDSEFFLCKRLKDKSQFVNGTLSVRGDVPTST